MYRLHVHDDQWGLLDQEEPAGVPVIIDFVSGRTAYRRKYGHAGGEAISRAVGIKKGHRPNVVDATAGLGRDAFVLATMGCQVHMIERSAVIAKLLGNALQRAVKDEKIGKLIQGKLSLMCADSRQALLRAPFTPEVIYLDPMFPQKDKSALVKKDMRMLQEVVGHDVDADELLSIALSVATKRVVVKRPAYADYLAIMAPHTSIKTKKHRFDIYLVKK